jgi:hypothetical protein
LKKEKDMDDPKAKVTVEAKVPQPPSGSSSTRKAVESIAEEAGVSAVVFALLKNFGKETIVVLVENAIVEARRSLEDRRGEIVAQIYSLDNSKGLNDRYAEAKARGEEANFVTLLCKLPKDKDGSRKYILEKLSALSKEDFENVLSMLEHDNLMQYIRKSWVVLMKVLKGDCEDVKTSLGNICVNASAETEKALEIVNRGSQKLAPFLRRQKQKLHDKGVRR